MSPTSYQAAPPRTTTIADAHASVKLAQTGALELLLREEASTTRCKVCSRTEKLEWNSSARQPCPYSFDPGSAPRYRIVAPSPPHPSSGPWVPCANSRPALNPQVIV